MFECQNVTVDKHQSSLQRKPEKAHEPYVTGAIIFSVSLQVLKLPKSINQSINQSLQGC